jgi:hypothetical protein
MRPTTRILAAVLAFAPAFPAAAAPTPRTLDEITIEGEVRLPQVLFITSRESTRPLDWLEHYGPPTAAEVARDTPLPGRIDVIPSAESADGIESPDASAAPSITEDVEEPTKESQR